MLPAMIRDERVRAVIDRVDNLRNEVDDHWQIPRVEAELLHALVLAGGCRSICEIGVSYGFSTLHLAAAAAVTGGHIHAVDLSPKKIAAASDHLREAGLGGVVTLHEGDARDVVAGLTPAEPFDFVFIDAVKSQSDAYLDAVWPKLAGGVMLATDNTRTHPGELGGFVQRLRALEGFASVDVPVGNGFELTVRRP